MGSVEVAGVELACLSILNELSAGGRENMEPSGWGAEVPTKLKATRVPAALVAVAVVKAVGGLP